ncbi:LysR family transcriptional regulator [Alginatibacterium sediminis]|uniref:LysR family transcriptional regulator n=1 Tax=Alginatibacterium sediminis TaxID=2164068 RepID=UPI001314A297|nr:LysR family transcriptional regulator [Alginatibacterium sediminis]
MIDSDSIQVFLAVVEHGSLTKAAKKLGRSHPTLGRVIAAMEDELGYKLFVREASGKSMLISERGKRLLSRAELTLATVEQFSTLASQLFDDSMPETLRLAIPDLLPNELIADLFSQVYTRWPHLNIEISQPSIFEGYGLLMSQRVDGLLVLREDATLRGLLVDNLGTIGFNIYANPSHPLSLLDGTRVAADFTPYRMFWPKTGSNDVSRLQWESWALSTSYTQNFSQAAAFAAQGLGAAPLPDFTAKPYVEAGVLQAVSLDTVANSNIQLIDWMVLESYEYRDLMLFVTQTLIDLCNKYKNKLNSNESA